MGDSREAVMGEHRRDSMWDRHGVVAGIVGKTPLPRMLEIEQTFENDTLKDIPGKIAEELSKEGIASRIRPGMEVAIAVGSRGIANLSTIVREIVTHITRLGGKPFIFPAMGSHGGATAEGQLELLASYGVTEPAMKAPIRSSMETIELGRSSDGKPVYLDKHAWGAGGIVVVGRVKPHTCFRGEFESGLMKMMAIGMAKQKGAESCHVDGFGKMAHNIEAHADVVMAKTNILFGVAIVENAFDDTCRIEAIPVQELKVRESALLVEARRLMPRIPFPRFDILVVRQIGKNFSGDGADPNVSGTFGTPYASGGPEFQRYVILDISDETQGNANGVGMADFTTKRVFDKTDFDAMYPNALTSTVVNMVRMPLVLESDRLALKAAVFCCTGIDKAKPRIVLIRNTSHLERLWISEALLEEASRIPAIRLLEQPRDLVFDESGALETARDG